MSKLSGYVLAHGPDGTVLLSPDDPLPEWANRETIPNPKAWADDESAPTDEQAPAPDESAPTDEQAPAPDESAPTQRRR